MGGHQPRCDEIEAAKGAEATRGREVAGQGEVLPWHGGEVPGGNVQRTCTEVGERVGVALRVALEENLAVVCR